MLKIKFIRKWYITFPVIEGVDFPEEGKCLIHNYGEIEVRSQVEVSPIGALGLISRAVPSSVFEDTSVCWGGSCPNTNNCPVWEKLSSILREEIFKHQKK